MSIKEYHVCEGGRKTKVLDVLKGTQKRDVLNKLRKAGYIIRKIYN